MFIIPGFTPSDKVPGVVARGEYGAGKLSVGQIPLVCTLFGNKGSAGTAPLDERSDCTTPEEADTLCGARSELARMAHAALDVPGVTLKLVPVEEVSGGTPATFILDVTGTWAASGELTIQLDEQVIRVPVGASQNPTTFGDALEDAANQAQDGRLFCVAVNTAGRVVFTVFSVGVRGNQHCAFLDTSLLPSGMSVAPDLLSAVVQSGTGPAITVAGTDTVDATYVVTISLGGANGTATFGVTRNAVSLAAGVTVPTTPFTYPIPGTSIIVTFGNGTHVIATTHTWTGVAQLSTGAYPFSLGAGTDDIDDALDGTESVTNDYIGLAQNDVTNVGLVEDACNAKAAFDVGRLEQYVSCRHRGLTDAIALGQTGMNDQLGTCLWPQNHVEHPSRLAARFAALLSVTDGAQPNTNFDEMVLPGAAPHKNEGDNPNRSTLNSALNNSLTPLITVNGDLQIVRAICSRSLNGSTPDYRTYDHGDVAVAIRVRKEAVALGQQLKAENPYDGPDVEEGLPPPGTFTPKLWESRMNALLQEWEGPNFNWLESVADNPCIALWDSTAKRTMSVVPTIAKHQFHQLGIIVRQTAA